MSFEIHKEKSKNILKMIAISEPNYFELKKLGCAGDLFNDVVTELLRKVKNQGVAAAK